MTGWMDTHCHLCLLKEEQGSTLAVMQRARANKVHRVLDVSTGKDNWRCVLDNALAFDDVYAAIGIHPTSEAIYSEDDWQTMATLAAHDKVIAIGECGLDFYHAPESECGHQYERFERQIELAKQLNKPLIIHTRHSSPQTLAVLRDVGKGLVTGIMHCFVEDKETAQQALDIGFYISFSGISTFKNAALVHETMRYVPLDKLLIETDSPYLAPVPHRGKLNEPAYVAQVGARVAEIKGLPIDLVVAQLELNARRLFGISL
jgi:TatD DNase family protein